MTDTLTLYTNPMSRGRIIRWMLEEIGTPYTTEILDYATTLKSAEYCAINPMAKIPAIKHGDGVVTETSAICAYLADAFPEAGLAPPPGSKDRAAYYRWLFFAAGPIETALFNHSLNVQIPPEKAAAAGYGSYEKVLDVLEQTLSATEYLAGGKFSAADLYVGAQIGFGLRFKSIEPRPAFRDFATRVWSRPAAIRAGQIDDALLAPAA